MRIEDLLEFEGLTAEMVREYIARLGHPVRPCPRFPVCPKLGRHTHHGTDDSRDLCIANDLTQPITAAALGLLAALAGVSIQSLLSEINPRMRPGWPTEEEIEAHEKRGGLWMASSAEDGLSFGSFCADRSRFAVKRAAGWGYRQDADAEVCFWPCDAHGNKVSRGTR